MKDTTISIFFSNGDSLEIDLARETQQTDPDNEPSEKTATFYKTILVFKISQE